MRPDQELIMALAELSCAAPREWTRFRAAFANYSGAELAAMMVAPAEQLQRMQGRAQQCASLSSLFEDPVAAANGVVKATAGLKAK